jgi:hypothetical protein
MRTRGVKTILVASVLMLAARPSAADDDQPLKTEVTIVDIETLPRGELPAPPAESDAPTGVPAWTQPETITVTAAGEVQRPRRRKPSPSIRVSKKSSINSHSTEKVKLVAIAPASPSLDAMYAPSADVTELEAQDTQKMSCGDRESVLPMRWESLATTAEGDARLAVRDLWFDAKSCAVGPGPEKTIPLKAIAWEGGKPWLFAMRSHGGVTLVMPRASEVTSESMVGAPVSLRGAFTRVSLPVGRWGSASIVAQLDSLTDGPSSDGAERPVEVGIELVQTMSERAPTLLVRTRRAQAKALDEARD